MNNQLSRNLSKVIKPRKAPWVLVGLIVLILISLLLKGGFTAPLPTNPHYGTIDKDRPVLVLFRLDDVSAISNTKFELDLLQLFQKYRIPIALGVIPYVFSSLLPSATSSTTPIDSLKASVLLPYVQDGIAEIALHGYTHQKNGVTENSGEFPGLSYQRQFDMLARGDSLLRRRFGREILTFIPPYNQYDMTTVNALSKLNYTCISASRDYPGVEDIDMSYLPFTCTLKNLGRSIWQAELYRSSGAIIVCMMHSTDFKESNKQRIGFTSLGELNGILNGISRNSHIATIRFDEAQNYFGKELGVSRLDANREKLRALNWALPVLYYSTAQDAARLRVMTIILSIIVYLIALFLTSFISMKIFVLVQRKYHLLPFVRLALSAIIVLIFVYFYMKWGLMYRLSLIFCVTLGVVCGLLITTSNSNEEKH